MSNNNTIWLWNDLICWLLLLKELLCFGDISVPWFGGWTTHRADVCWSMLHGSISHLVAFNQIFLQTDWHIIFLTLYTESNLSILSIRLENSFKWEEVKKKRNLVAAIETDCMVILLDVIQNRLATQMCINSTCHIKYLLYDLPLGEKIASTINFPLPLFSLPAPTCGEICCIVLTSEISLHILV